MLFSLKLCNTLYVASKEKTCDNLENNKRGSLTMVQKSDFSNSLIAVASCCAISFAIAQLVPVLAEQKTDTGEKSSTTGSTTADTINTLKTEQQQLRRMGEAVKRTKRAALDLIQECTQPVEMMGEIDIIGQDVIPIMPATAEGFGGNYAPPRPKYIDLHMSQLNAIVPILQDEVKTLSIPEEEKEFAKQPLEDLNGNMGDMLLHLKKLQALTKSVEDWNVQEMLSESKGIISTVKELDSARKKLLHIDEVLEKKEEKLERQEKSGKK